ncbi:hypothetical protein [Candidatus Fonsibacter ubiquis]|uniref:hypothetical protein n=1 Tax=Candidatus Fonsibacter ubiquis TaxID=1925548 RepID=UPI000C078E56|nr:hypothetical protein [Candidatus Fonsibacter ubiquis]
MSEDKQKEIIEVKEVEAERINREETFRPRFKRIRLSPLFLISILIYIISGIWGLFICFAVVKDVFGPIIAFLGLIFFPFILTLAPWYAALANHDFYPLLIVYGGIILGTFFFRIAIRSTFKNQ